MINTIAEISEIVFEPSEIDDAFLESIRTRGIAIPVRVRKTEEGYECVDGRKRLTAAAVLCKDIPRLARVPVMIVNDFSKAGSAFWGNTRNKH